MRVMLKKYKKYNNYIIFRYGCVSKFKYWQLTDIISGLYFYYWKTLENYIIWHEEKTNYYLQGENFNICSLILFRLHVFLTFGVCLIAIFFPLKQCILILHSQHVFFCEPFRIISLLHSTQSLIRGIICCFVEFLN